MKGRDFPCPSAFGAFGRSLYCGLQGKAVATVGVLRTVLLAQAAASARRPSLPGGGAVRANAFALADWQLFPSGPGDGSANL